MYNISSKFLKYLYLKGGKTCGSRNLYKRGIKTVKEIMPPVPENVSVKKWQVKTCFVFLF